MNDSFISAFGDQPHGEPFIVPLAVPALAGPSALMLRRIRTFMGTL